MKKENKLAVFTDGGARGNPGPAAVGVVIQTQKGRLLETYGQTIGIATNNTAEYQAVIAALHILIKKYTSVSAVVFHLDSQVVARQLMGVYRVKEIHLRHLMTQIRALEKSLGATISYTHIPRNQNHQADQLLNRALDQAFS